MVVTDPFHHAGRKDSGVINNIKTGDWVLYTRREKAVFGETIISLVLMHSEAAVAMHQFGGNLVGLSDVYGTGFKPEHFRVSIDRRLVGFFDFAVYLKEKERRLTNDYLVEVLRSGEDSVTFKGSHHAELRRFFEAGILVNTLRNPRTVDVSTLRDEDNQAVAVFLYLGREPQ